MFSLVLLLLMGVEAETRTPDLSWLAGYWLSCDGSREVSETWSDPRAGVLLGTSLTVSRGRLTYEQSRIGPSAAGISFFAQPSGQAPAEFPLVSSGERRVVFENPAHDFPQRVLYWRVGDTLHARIEGTIDGKSEAADWHYAAAPLNQRCAGAGEGD